MKNKKARLLSSVDKLSTEEYQYWSDLVVSLLEDYLLMIDICHWVDKLINTANPDKHFFWDVENKINGIKTLFLLFEITNEDHQEALEDLVYKMSSETLNEDISERAIAIKDAFFKKIRLLRN